MAYPVFIYSRSHIAVVKAAYSVTPTTTWGDLDTTTDLTLPAAVGDTVKVCVNALWGGQNEYGCLTAATLVSSTLTNWIDGNGGEPTTTTGDGVSGWFGSTVSGTGFNTAIGSPKRYVVQAGDLVVGGLVTFRFRVRTSGGTKLFGAGDAAEFSAENIGPVYGS